MLFPLHFSFESASFQIKAPEPDQRFFLLIRIIHLTNGFPLLLLFFYFYFSFEFDTLCFHGPGTGTLRAGICPSRQCRRQCKIFAGGVNFSIFTHFFLLKLLKLGEIDGVKF